MGHAADDRGDVERKTVSVLFADLVGFTSSAANADPEDVASRLETFHNAVRTDIERYGGRIEKLIGDGVFAVFGAPISHEDDAERAVRSALRLQETITSLNETDETELAVRVAVTTGEAMVRLGGTTQDLEGIVGDVVNTASRLQQIAPEGGVIVDETTYSATHRVAEYQEPTPVTIKGKSDPILVRVAIRMKSRFGVGVDVDETTAFVGREDSLRLLVDSFERAIGSHTAQLVTVSGEPGVGKTRLVAEFRRIIDDRSDLVWWRQGHCLPYGDGISFWALGEIVKAHAGVLDGEPGHTVRTKIISTAEDLIEDRTQASWVGERLLELIGATTSESSKRERFTAWTQFLESLAARNPLVMVIDDLHWADPSLVEFLDELVETDEGVPLLVVVTARPELYDPHPGWGGGKRNSTSIALGPLSPEETAELVGMLTDSVDSEAATAALQRSGGNPLYATELVRMAADRQASGSSDGAIPGTIQSVIASRIDLLAPEDKHLLQTASVVGKVFWSGAVAFATGTSADDVDESLKRLARRELIKRARRSSMRDHDEYTFWHDLVADVAYGQIPRRSRRDAHKTVGQWLEATAGERIGELAEILAYHFSEALDLSRALGVDDERLELAARRHLLEAGRRAENVNAEKAISLLSRALDLSSAPADQAEILIRLANAQSVSMGGEKAVGFAQQASAAAIESGSVELMAEATTVLSRTHWLAGNGEGAHETTRHALSLVESMPDGPTLTKTLTGAIGTLYLRGDFAGLQELIDRALEVGREYGPRPDYLQALKWAGTFAAEQGDPRGITWLREAYDGAVALGDTNLQITTTNNLASFLTEPEQIDEAIEICESAIALGRARGALSAGDFTRLTLCEALWHLGRWSEIVPHFEYLIDTYGSGNYTGLGGLGWRVTHSVFTKHPRAYEWSEEHLDRARRIQDHQSLAPVIAARVEMLRRHDEIEEALILVREFDKLTEDRPVFRANYFGLMAPMLAGLGEIDWLESLIGGLDQTDDAQNVSFFAGIAARARNEAERAVGLLDVALGVAEASGSPWAVGQVLVERAAAKIDLGDSDAARSDLEEASDRFAMLGPSVFDDFVASQRARLSNQGTEQA